MEELRLLLMMKFEEIGKRTTSALAQLSDEQVNWRPNESSNSIANLIVHMCGNVNERIHSGIHKREHVRHREQEFEPIYMTNKDLQALFQEAIDAAIETVRTIDEQTWNLTQPVRQKVRSNGEILFQCAAHFSEHMGQILYIAKICLNDKYVSTSIPKKER